MVSTSQTILSGNRVHHFNPSLVRSRKSLPDIGHLHSAPSSCQGMKKENKGMNRRRRRFERKEGKEAIRGRPPFLPSSAHARADRDQEAKIDGFA